MFILANSADNWFTNTWRTVCSFIDRVVYWFIEVLISLFDAIADIRIFSGDNDSLLTNITNRIYLFIAIIMIFKVSFSIIQYIINPDNMNKGENGFGKVIQNVILSLVLLVVTPYIFDFAYNIQGPLVEAVPKIILGIAADDETKKDEAAITAEEQAKLKSSIPIRLLSAFIQPNYRQNYDITLKNAGFYCEKSNAAMLKEDGSYNDKFSDCLTSISLYTYFDGEDIPREMSPSALLAKAYNENQYSLLLDIVNAKKDDSIYLFEYKWLFSTVAGIFVIIMYINFCIDIAIRTVKFSFLELISAVPIISMVDPKSSKSGMMSKWVKQCFNTYLGLFIRIFAVSLVVLICQIIFAPSFLSSISGDYDVRVWTSFVIFFGALMFAKELPKMISDLTGIDLKGDFNMNPFKRIPGLNVANKLGGAALTGAIGGVGGAVAAGIATGKNGKNVGAIIGSSVMGLGRGMFGGMKAGYGSGLKGAAGATSKTVSGIGNRYMSYGDSTLMGRLGSSIRTSIGLPTVADDYEKQIKHLDEYSKYKSQLKSLADYDTTNVSSESFMATYAANIELMNASENGVKGLKEYYEDLQNSGTATLDEISQARNAYETAQKHAITNGNTEQLKSAKTIASNYAKRYQLDKVLGADVLNANATYETINKASIDSQNEISRIQSTTKYTQSVIDRDAAKNAKGK